MNKATFDFWQDHSLHYLEMALRTDRREIVEHPDGYGKKRGVCGDTVEIFLSLRHGRIETISYNTDGCIHTNACTNTVALLAEAKTLDEAWGITPEDVIAYLETLPREQFHCAELAVGTLYLALADAGRKKTAPSHC